ncbi:hypothetical protein [Mesorhizobium marinum]|uniref:site-specific DNA-methyltransferase (cytosine-N(4)-specific) n=2 Tax=Mesorhizobium marinum TaxID=3228790 RepID=A0ABV3R0Z4_9HYPH
MADKLTTNEALTRSLVSFQGNKKQPFYRWLKYKEAFSSDFVRLILDRYAPKGGVVFDPFAGSGTALFASVQEGHVATGTELLPIGIAVAAARAAAQRVKLDKMVEARRNLASLMVGPGKPLRHLRMTKGAFSESNDAAIASYRGAVSRIRDKDVKCLLHFAGLCVLEESSFTRKDGQYLRWDYRSGKNVDSKFHKGVIKTFAEAVGSKLDEMIEDIAGRKEGVPMDVAINQESFFSYGLKMPKASVDLVVTSPPYCNRYDYTRTYALELLYLDYTDADVSALRQSLLTATVENRPKMEALRSLFAEHDEDTRFAEILETYESVGALHEVVAILEQAATDGSLNNPNIPRMVRNYFFEMAIAISNLSRITKRGAKVVMVNDNVRYFGEEVPVDLILSAMAERLGFSLEGIWVLPRGKGNSSQQMGAHGRTEIRKCVYIWKRR